MLTPDYYQKEIERTERLIQEAEYEKKILSEEKIRTLFELEQINQRLVELAGAPYRIGLIDSLRGDIPVLLEEKKLASYYERGIPFIAQEPHRLPDVYKTYRAYKATAKRIYFVYPINNPYQKDTLFQDHLPIEKGKKDFWNFKLDTAAMLRLLPK